MRADRQDNGLTHMTKITLMFRDFANVWTKNHLGVQQAANKEAKPVRGDTVLPPDNASTA